MSEPSEEAKLEAANQKHLGLIRAVWNHFTSWLEVYWWLPLALLSIIAAAHFARYLTGRPPQANADFLVDYASRFVLCIAVIIFLSITREQTGFWLTKEESFANPKVYIAQTASKCFFAAVFVYLLTH